jgi:hypothetical protein
MVEAIRYNGRNTADIHEFAGNCVREPVGQCYMEIETKEGVMTISPGDYVIREPFPTNDRQYYPCKPSIFEQTYEPVENSQEKT